VLGSIDQIDRRLRERLGEALASISKDSQPLERVGTKSLDALRAYSLGQRAYFHGSMQEALGFYQEAVKLDPQFALAHMAVARVMINSNEFAAALQSVQLAAASSDRLTARDALFVDAWQTTLTKSSGALEKWQSLTRLYPDFYTANGFYADAAARANLYDQAIEAAHLNASEHNANPSAGMYLLGILYLATDRYNESGTWFRRAAEAGFVRNDFYAMLPGARRQFDQAESLMRRNRLSGRAGDDFGAEEVKLTLLVDQGHWSQLPAELEIARAQAKEGGERMQQRFNGIELALRSAQDLSDVRALAAYARSEAHAQTTNVLDHDEALFHALFATYLLARAGDPHTAETLIAALETEVGGGDDLPLRNLLVIAKAEAARASGRTGPAVDMLSAQISGNEIYLTHLALLDALASAGDTAGALTQAGWVASHRGRAYAGYGPQQFLTAYVVVQSDLALLRSAELLAASGRKDAAHTSLQNFMQVWPQAEWPAAVAARVAQLSKVL